MLENFVDKMKVYGDSFKAERANKSEKGDLQAQKEKLNGELSEAYNQLGKAFFEKQALLEIPEEYQKLFQQIIDIQKEIEDCDLRMEESDHNLAAKKKELDDRMMEIEERAKEQKEQREKKNQQAETAAPKPAVKIDVHQETADYANQRHCPNCGTVVDDDALFCFQCGSKLVHQEQKQEEQEEQKPEEEKPEE